MQEVPQTSDDSIYADQRQPAVVIDNHALQTPSCISHEQMTILKIIAVLCHT